MAIDIIGKMIISVLLLASTSLALDYDVSGHQATFDLHSAIQQYITNLKNANRLSHFKAEAMQFNRRSFVGLQLEEGSSFENISQGCAVNINRLVDGLRNESEWAFTGKTVHLKGYFLNFVQKKKCF